MAGGLRTVTEGLIGERLFATSWDEKYGVQDEEDIAAERWKVYSEF